MITYLLIGITVALSFLAWNKPQLKASWIHNPYAANRGQLHRLLTSGFIHADYMHLFLNMWALYLFGGVVERNFNAWFGPKATFYFLALYLIGIVFANLPDFFQKKNNVHFNSLGASGGVSSIVFAAVLIYPLMELIIFPIPIPMPAYIFSVLYVGYSIYMEKRQKDNVNHMAHLYGALWGIVFLVLVKSGILSQFVQQIAGSF